MSHLHNAAKFDARCWILGKQKFTYEVTANFVIVSMLLYTTLTNKISPIKIKQLIFIRTRMYAYSCTVDTQLQLVSIENLYVSISMICTRCTHDKSIHICTLFSICTLRSLLFVLHFTFSTKLLQAG